MIKSDPNVQMVEGLMKHLTGMANEFALVGGCATGLLITEQMTSKVRPTLDVDLVASLTTKLEYDQVAERLRDRGFKEDITSGVICRWKIDSFLIDVIPTGEKVFGFGNSWLQKAYDTAVEVSLPSGKKIRLITSPYFIATKVIAFQSRGNSDFKASHDMEDIITIINGRKELVEEVHQSDNKLQDFLRDEFEVLLLNPAFTESISYHLLPDDISQSKSTVVFERLRAIAQF